MKYTKFDFEYGTLEEDLETYDYVRLPYENSGKTKVLFVLDHVPSEDLKSGRLLSGVTGDLLNSLIRATKKLYDANTVSFSWLACCANAFRTYGKSAEFRAQAETEFKKRLTHIILKYQPDYVVAFGQTSMRILLGDKLVQAESGKLKYSYWLGVPVEREFKKGSATHKTKVVSNISLNDIVQGDSGEAGLLGYMCKCLTPIFGRGYFLDSSKLMHKGCTVVDTLEKFDKLMDYMCSQKAVAIDTEAKNLHKITNQLFTVQMACTSERAYLIPVSHKDSPFTQKEIKHICARFQRFFEGENENDYHIYTNAKFDLTLFRSSCNVRYFKNPVWDILGGEFGLDENLKSLDLAIGEYYYSLGNLSVQYGFEGYLNAEFSKQHRANFASADLTDPSVIEYCGYDVCVPFAIHELQKKRGRDSKYAGFCDVVLNEISDTIHAFSKMEHTGAGLDVNYLFYLKTDESPIEAEIDNMLNALLKTEASRKANKLLAAKSNIPTESMFGSMHQTAMVFRLNKPEHRRTFFFDVLKLKPLAVGKSGVGKIDKAFQQAYAHVPEVAQFTALEKAKKLRNAYVNSFITMLGENEDLQKDHRIRPDYGYLTVVTHRGSARNPNLQQVPAHSALGKHIKRLFVSRPGTLYIKVDYRVHEVRGWGLISYDNAVAEVFAAAKKLRDAYRLNPTPELAKRIKVEADVHIQNVMIFFVKTLDQINSMAAGDLKKLRNAVKGIIFGFIYGMGTKTMASNIGQELDFTEKLLATFAKRFPKAVKWSKGVKTFARENWFVEAPTKIRRHLWGYMLPPSMEQASQIAAQNDRQAGNAPIQGMCSKFMMNGIRVLDQLCFKQLLKDPAFQLYISNSVHDSLENEVGYANFIRGLRMIEWALTDGVKSAVRARYGFELVSDLEIDFEIGAALSETEAWDFSVHQLDRLVMDSLLFQRNKLGHTLNVAHAYSLVFSKKALSEDAPNWMKTQIKNLGYKFELTEKSYISEILKRGKAKIADAEALEKNDDNAKRIKELMSEGKDLIDYARELNGYRHEYC